MIIKNKVIEGTLLLSGGRLAERGLQFLRNMIVARLVSPEDFGIAALFVLTVNFLEMISNLAVDTLLIQSPDGDNPRFQQTSQFIVAVRGLGISLILFFFATPMAQLFNIPKASWAFRFLALVPFIRGLAHQDISRLQRSMNFRPLLLADISSQFVSVLLAWPIASRLGNYSALLYLLLLQNLTRVVFSHLFSERPYRWGWDPVYARAILSFGWPLLINGILFFLIMQGDRFVIGAADSLFSRETYSKTQLGYYSAAFLLASTVIDGIVSILSPVMLPLLSRVQDDNKIFQEKSRLCVSLSALIVCILGIYFIIAGGWLLIIVYGKQYEDGVSLMAWLGVSFSLRLFRISFSTIALSKGDSPIMTITNSFRVVSFLLAFLVAAYGLPIVWIAASALIGELLAIIVNIWLLKQRLGLPLSLLTKPILLISSTLLVGIIGWVSGLSMANHFIQLLISVILSFGIAGLFIILFPEFRSKLFEIISIAKGQ